jgi:YesN/AraC family two-component response regulator
MESNCCLKVVQDELHKLGIQWKTLELGRVELNEAADAGKLERLDNALRNIGLEILHDSKTLLIEKVKDAIHHLVYLSDDLPKQNISDVIRQKVNHNYTYISSLFSNVVGIRIEEYLITTRIDRVKELLVYDKLSLNEISYLLKYSSIAHLSNQFKKVTGMTPASYRQLAASGKNKKQQNEE